MADKFNPQSRTSEGAVMYAHKTRLHPNNEQANFFARCAGTRRFAYNWGLERWQKMYEAGEKPRASDIDKQLNQIKKEKFPWMYEVRACVAQEAIKYDLHRAFTNFFRRVKNKENPGYPKIKKKFIRDSFTFTNIVLKPEHIQDNHLVLPKKMGKVRMGDKPRYDGKLLKTTISRHGDRWYVSLMFEVEPTVLSFKPAHDSIIGVDLGVAKLATCDDGRVFKNIGAWKSMSDKLARAQRKLAKMEMGSNNRNKQKKRIGRLYRQLSHIRENYAHQMTTRLTRAHNVIAIEDLRVANMTASAKGTVESPGKNVKAKSALNRSILDGGFRQIRSQLEYKATRHSGRVIAVDPAYTSQTCPACGHVSADNRKTQAKFECVECGFKENADIVGAINIKMRAIQDCAASGA